jgi:acetyl esterase/lipase
VKRLIAISLAVVIQLMVIAWVETALTKRVTTAAMTAATTTETHAYGTHPQQTLDVSWDPASTMLKPIMMVVHGGTWDAGTKADIAEAAAKWEAAGFVVANVEYRYAATYGSVPGSSWPAQRNDLRSAIAWMKAHASQFNADTNSVVAYGFSAGGHMAITTAVSGGSGLDGAIGVAAPVQPDRWYNELVSGVLPVQNRKFAIRATNVVNCGDITWTSCRNQWNTFLPDKLADATDPPTLMYFGADDTLVNSIQADSIKYWFGQRGAPTTVVKMAGYGHDEGMLLDTAKWNEAVAWALAVTS